MYTVPTTLVSEQRAVPWKPRVPSTIGPYELAGRLGRGGMSDVYRARHLRTGQVVALKVMRPVGKSLRTRVACFDNEVTIMASLEHPNIAGLLASGSDPQTGLLYMAMPLIRGRCLHALIREARAQPHRVRSQRTKGTFIPAFLQLCNALAYAHRQKIIHRDLKPSNVLVDRRGKVTLLDWGIALAIAPPDRQEELVARRQGRARRAMPRFGGTPGYMSAEQIQEHAFAQDARSDIWALGAILFELVAFDRLVAGKTEVETMRRTIARDFTRLTPRDSVRPVAVALMPVVRRATAEAPDDRFQTVEALAVAVGAAARRLTPVWPDAGMAVA